MDFRPVRDAYSSTSGQDFALATGDPQAPGQVGSLIRRTWLMRPGAVLDLGCGPGTVPAVEERTWFSER